MTSSFAWLVMDGSAQQFPASCLEHQAFASSDPPLLISPSNPLACSNAANALSEDNSLLQVPVWRNPWLLVAMAVSLGLHAVILYVPFLANIFSIVPLSLNEWLLVLAYSLPVILLEEASGRGRGREGRVSGRCEDAGLGLPLHRRRLLLPSLARATYSRHLPFAGAQVHWAQCGQPPGGADRQDERGVVAFAMQATGRAAKLYAPIHSSLPQAATSNGLCASFVTFSLLCSPTLDFYLCLHHILTT